LTPVHMSRDKGKAAPAIWSKSSEKRTIARGRRDVSPLVSNHCIRIGEYNGRKKTTPDNNLRICGLIPHVSHRRQFQEHRESNCPNTSEGCGERRTWRLPTDNEPKARSFEFPPIPLSSSNSSDAKQSVEGPAEPLPSLQRTSHRPSEDKGSGVGYGPKMP